MSKEISKEEQELRKMSNKKFIQYFKDWTFDFKTVLSIGRYELWYYDLLEREMARRDLF